jgi:antitoxin (DNA-binding transcriptional repressor) of toxin-antitoxin stability system
MKTINTRDLVHHSKEIRRTLDAGERIAWQSRGKLIAMLEPASKQTKNAHLQWLDRARQAGAINTKSESVSDLVYADRD